MSTHAEYIAIAAPAGAFTIGAVLTFFLARSPEMFAGMIDQPNARSLHSGTIPRTGGIAIIAAMATAGLASWFMVPMAKAWATIAASAVLVAAVSLIDDRGSVKPAYRLAAHIAAALLLLLGGLSWSPLEFPGIILFLPVWLASLMTLLFVVWMVNLYNFMDGMDGFAGGMTLFGFGALALLGWRADDLGFFVISASIAAAGCGFLLGNFPPARIFLGDMGSATLGLLAAALSLLGSEKGLFPLWVAWIAFSPFIVDATWTLLVRMARRERVWQAHRSHHYQRLVLAGWSHRRTVIRAYLLMAACAATSVAAPAMSVHDQWFLLGAWAIIYALIGYKTHLVERQAAVDGT